MPGRLYEHAGRTELSAHLLRETGQRPSVRNSGLALGHLEHLFPGAAQVTWRSSPCHGTTPQPGPPGWHGDRVGHGSSSNSEGCRGSLSSAFPSDTPRLGNQVAQGGGCSAKKKSDNTSAVGCRRGAEGGTKQVTGRGVARPKLAWSQKAAGSLPPGSKGGTDGPQLCLWRRDGVRRGEEGHGASIRLHPILHRTPFLAIQQVEQSLWLTLGRPWAPKVLRAPKVGQALTSVEVAWGTLGPGGALDSCAQERRVRRGPRRRGSEFTPSFALTGGRQ